MFSHGLTTLRGIDFADFADFGTIREIKRRENFLLWQFFEDHEQSFPTDYRRVEDTLLLFYEKPSKGFSTEVS